jgi:hypothetical protein
MKSITIKKQVLIVMLLISALNVISQAVPDSVYHERLFYLCKAWGHAKYRHTEIANGSINWDDELFTAIQGAKYSPDNEGFNEYLQMMLDNAGEMGISPDPLPEVPDSLNNITDYSWIQADIFSDTVKTLLDTIRARFRPQPNVYVGEAWEGGNPTFLNDDLYYDEYDYPDEEKRLLALFRYWNIINYFFPYKNIMDQDWDTTLVEFIPRIAGAENALSYSLACKELTTRINDTHAFFYSPAYQTWRGAFFPPFLAAYVENEMVITKALASVPDLSAGDVIKAIDGVDIYILRDSLRKYAQGSNDVVIQRELNYIILWGPSGASSVVVDNGNSIDTVTITRNSSNYAVLNNDNSPVWQDTVLNGSCHFGIVNMGKLLVSGVNDMFTELWETDAIIFDIRNYPNNTLWEIVNYLYSGPINIANFTVPDIDYPGRLYWYYEYIGSGAPNSYEGEVIILFNEETQSQAEYTCMGIEQFPGAIKIGSTTAAADGNVSQVFLPGNIYTYFTGLGTFYPDYSPTQRVGIIPDYEVIPTIAGIRAGIDEVLAYAMDCKWFGTPEFECQEDFTVYPNPASWQLTIGQLDSWAVGQSAVRLSIVDLFGREIKDFGNVSSLPHQVDISDLTDGVYLLRISDGDKVVGTVKFLKIN